MEVQAFKLKKVVANFLQLGLLAIRGKADHDKAMHEHNIPPIDLVICNLYPFENTVAKV